ncbi:hypothetical protein [Pampinifervens florentissimum]|uniref:hypothetical protein n=1 Tax=Pampinifervens florentissimum TaxID=1632019 RepID=UPI0013B492B5|nr:hypothetical protein [Hydrogenobacter sp. T-8]QID33361.1 hypothetical protein G3M65_06105 [Hydrogenobacter sp. T-8]
MEDTAYEELMDIINEIYAQEPIELGCGEINCFLCAKGGRLKPCDRLREAVILLPGENRLLTLLNGKAFPEMNVNGFSIGFLAPEEDCPFNVDGWCGIHGRHPIDCRSFPIVPSVNERGDLIVSIALNCPVIPPWGFTKRWVENWRRIWGKAPLEWFKFYSSVPTNPLKPVAIFRAEEKDDREVYKKGDGTHMV